MKNEYPLNDTDFEEVTIQKVNEHSIVREDGYSFSVPSDSPVKPKVGMSARFYPKAAFAFKRGFFLDGQKLYYRTDEEQQEYQEIEQYGADAKDWLDRWDAGKSVWSIEMGGLGPGYEQCIHITAAELLRSMLNHKFQAKQWTDADKWKSDREVIEAEAFKNDAVSKLGLSGAQFGAAMRLATQFYMDGPRKVMNDPSIKDRHIQVSRTFPQS